MPDPRVLGASKNNPVIDDQTHSLQANSSPAVTGKRRKKNNGADYYFDVSQLLPILTANRWTVGHDFMKFWIDGNACTAKKDKKKDKATIGANVDNACMRIFKVDWKWVLDKKFVDGKKGYDRFLKDRIFNVKAERQLNSTYGKTEGRFGGFLSEKMPLSDIRRNFKNHQIQNLLVEFDTSSQLTDMSAALANFGFYSMYKGEVIFAPNFEKKSGTIERYKDQLLRPLSPGETPSGINPSTSAHKAFIKSLKDENKAFWKSCAEHFEKIILIEQVGVFVGDIYEFNGWQYLGTWDLKNKKVTKSRFQAADTWLGYFPRGYAAGGRRGRKPAPLDQRKYPIENETFREYRKKTNKGGDFLVFSPMKMLNKKWAIPVYRM